MENDKIEYLEFINWIKFQLENWDMKDINENLLEIDWGGNQGFWGEEYISYEYKNFIISEDWDIRNPGRSWIIWNHELSIDEKDQNLINEFFEKLWIDGDYSKNKKIKIMEEE